jgi:8-oxo-dGTP diphosphatase
VAVCIAVRTEQQLSRFQLPRVIVAAIIIADRKVLACERSAPPEVAGRWEFPGGKVEPGERPEQTLIRELHEEIGITVSEPCLAPLTFASHAYESFHLLMPLYICRRWEGQAIAREGQNLAWVRAGKLRDYPMPPADIPLIPHLIDLLL